MAQRMNGVLGILEQVVRDCETVGVGDVGEWAKIFARLERVAEELAEADHVAADLAQLLTLAVERVVDGGVANQAALDVVKEGVLALQASYLATDNEAATGFIDQNLAKQLRSIVDQDDEDKDTDDSLDDELDMDEGMPLELEGSEMPDPSDVLDNGQPPVAEPEEALTINLDEIDWKAVPSVDLDALESKVAKEQSKTLLDPLEREGDRQIGIDDTDHQLAAEAQEIRAQLSETGYIVFENQGDALLPEVILDGDVEGIGDITGGITEEGISDLETETETEEVEDIQRIESQGAEDQQTQESGVDIVERIESADEVMTVEDTVVEVVSEKEPQEVTNQEDSDIDILDKLESPDEVMADEIAITEIDSEEMSIDEKDTQEMESMRVDSIDESVDDAGLDMMTGAVTAFLGDDSEDKSAMQHNEESTGLDDVDKVEKENEANMPVNIESDEDAFWTDAEPIVEPDSEVLNITAKPDDAGDENSVLAQIALGAVTMGIDDMSGLGRVHTQLETLAPEYSDRPLAAQLTRALAVVIEKVILCECDDVDDPLALICDGVTVLQQMDQEAKRGTPERFTNDALIAQVMEVAEIDLDGLDGLDEGGEGDLLPNENVQNEPVGPIDVDQDIFFDFASEAEEHLETAEAKLLELESHSEDKEVINAVFRSFHTIKGASSFLGLEDVTRVAHSVEDVLDSVRKGSLTLTPSILDVALESLDLLGKLIKKTKEALENGQPVYAEDVTGFVAKVERAAAGESVADVEDVVPQKSADPSSNGNALPPVAAPLENVEPQQERRSQSREQSYVRVGTEKLDQLVNLVGELVIAQTQVSQNPAVVTTTNQKLTKDISQLMKISTDIQEISMSMRMVPIRSTFERMARIVRDLARKCGKQVRFEVSGEDTELDKNVVEELVDPLTHMVRNAVDHGIEPEDDRETMGKPNEGSVHLNAYHKGGNIVIELRDDGKGLDRDKILKKAIERGLVQPDAQMSDEEVFLLVFLPGFSTAEQVSDISGRGVGMDVVRRNIEGLRGRVEVTSELGKGSTFTIRLPLTLAIIDGMVIGVGQERYILPMTAIVRSLRPEKEDLFYVMGKGEMIRVQDEVLPVVRLYKRFGVRPTCDDIWESLVVIVEAEGRRCGVMVDELLGMQQVVIKGLLDHLREEPCLSGCAILGDGRVGLILDPNGLIRQGGKADKTRESNGRAYRSAS
ncbi:MAG: two-component system chemotaxis sensor kinase CheA [Candidatus Latescibacterota bacterium]|jgi:two-component system chemotaxis sensor kinase CheA